MRKDQATEAEVELAAQAAEEGAQRRLNRLLQRREDETANQALDAEKNADKLREHFAECAFLILGVPMDADQGAVAQAVDDLAFAEDVDPDALETARAELLAPRDRIAHELAWLPEASAEDQADACKALEKGDADRVFELRLGASGLARINLGVALLTVRPKDSDLTRTLMADLLSWDANATRDRIDEARLRSGATPSKDSHFAETLSEFRRKIGRNVAEKLGETREGRVLLAEYITHNSAEIRACSTPMLEAIAHEYGALADPKLQNLRGKIDDAVASLEEKARDPAKVTLIITTLDLWSQWRFPLQKLEEARGLDDPLSADVFKKLRDLAITLTNEHKLYDESLRMARALKHCFAAVPGLQQAIEGDLPTLMGNVLFQRFDQLTEQIAKNFRNFIAEIDSHGMGSDVGGMVGRYCEVFDELLAIDPHQEGPWMLFREIAVATANKAQRRDIALQIVKWLLDRNSPEKVRNQLTQDFCQLQPRKD